MSPVAFFSWALYQHNSMVGRTSAQSISAVLVTNPFIEITNSSSGKLVASGFSALIIVSVLCGLVAGVIGLGIIVCKNYFSSPLR
jgi:hypothetical protein